VIAFSDSARGAGDEGDFAFQVGHFNTSFDSGHAQAGVVKPGKAQAVFSLTIT
jgi:hypothetical protein